MLFNGYTVSTLAGGSFSQTAFAFAVTGEVIEQGLTLALFVGRVGGMARGVDLGRFGPQLCIFGLSLRFFGVQLL